MKFGRLIVYILLNFHKCSFIALSYQNKQKDLYPPHRPLCIVGLVRAGERGKESARGMTGIGEIPSSHHLPLAFHFDYCYF